MDQKAVEQVEYIHREMIELFVNYLQKNSDDELGQI